MKKVFSIFLCLCMLLSVVALFASCQNPMAPAPEPTPEVPVPETAEGVQVSGATVEVDLTEYALVRPRNLSTPFEQQVIDFGTAIRDVCSVNIRPSIDREQSPVENGLYEVLIGSTQRVETVSAMAEINGHGWIIKAVNGKLIIAGTTDYLTRNAMDYFVANYLNADNAEGSTLTMPETVVLSGVEMIALVEGGEGRYEVVYSAKLDDKKGSEYGNEPAGTTYDYPVDVSSGVRNLLINKTGVRASTIPMKTDASEVTAKEIMIGNNDRAATKAVLATLEANEYGVVMSNGQVVITGWNKATLSEAYNVFNAMIQDSVVYDMESESNCILIPKTLTLTGTLSEKENKFIVDFPRPDSDGLELIDTEDVGDSSMLFVYAGTGVNRDNYLAYCAKLEAAGFSLYGPETQYEGSSFRTYLNSDGVNLQVSHFAYAHAEEQEVDLFTPSIRIVSSHTDYVSLPDAEILESDRSWIKRTDPMVTMLQLKYSTGNFGLSALITLEDGSFIVFDGGGTGETSEADDENYMYNVMVDIHKKVFGSEPTATNPIHIRGWIITHEHWDHQMVFYNFCKEYGNQTNVRIDRLFYNPASDEETYNCYNPDSTIEVNLLNGNIDKWIRGDAFEAIKIHTGQVFYLANAELRVMYTHEDIHPQELGYFNNSSSIFRITLHTTDREIGEVAGSEHIVNTETSMWLGDLERIGSKCLRAMYGDTLKADVVQVSHHGYNGCEIELYDLIDPEIVLWPTDSNTWIGQTKNPNTTTWFYQVDYHIAHNLLNAKLIVVAQYYNTTITFTENGPDYDNLWDALDHKIIETDDGDIGATDGRVIYRPNAGN